MTENLEKFIENLRSRRMTTQEYVTTAIRQLILNGYFEDGEQIETTGLIKKLGVSRMPLRNALIQLENEGLVINEPHKRAVAAKLSPNEVQNICVIRIELEALAIKLTIPHLDKEAIERLTTLIDEMDNSINDDGSQFHKLNMEFHQTIYMFCQNDFLKNLIVQLRNQVDRYLRIFISGDKNKHTANNEHREILQAMKEGNIAEAEHLIRKHLNHTTQYVIRRLKSIQSLDESEHETS